MSFSASIDTSRLKAKLAAAKAAAASGMRSGVARGAQVFEALAKQNAPVLTGRLRDGIHTETVTDTDTARTLMVTPVVAASNKEGFEPPYARRIELGFIGVDSLGRHYHQAAEPYMAPAYDEGREAAAKAVSDDVRSALKGVA